MQYDRNALIKHGAPFSHLIVPMIRTAEPIADPLIVVTIN